MPSFSPRSLPSLRRSEPDTWPLAAHPQADRAHDRGQVRGRERRRRRRLRDGVPRDAPHLEAAGGAQGVQGAERLLREATGKKLLDEFIQEGALLADLSARTAAIVQARDIGTLEVEGKPGIPYMVLEWLEGETLEATLLNEKGSGMPLRSAAEAVHLLDPAGEALALAHRKGIAHRDVKPGNVFVIGDARGEATVKLLDFGIAKVVSDAQKMAGSFTKTSGQVTSFTPAYGAPEQFSRTHGSTGPWTDVFALALIVVETITGREPLDGDDFVQLAVSSSNTERRPTPRTLGATVSDQVEAVLAKALAVKPTRRWQTAGDFWNALRLAVAMAPMRGMTDTSPVAPASKSTPLVATGPTVVA